jgi:hypothetical protein
MFSLDESFLDLLRLSDIRIVAEKSEVWLIPDWSKLSKYSKSLSVLNENSFISISKASEKPVFASFPPISPFSSLSIVYFKSGVIVPSIVSTWPEDCKRVSLIAVKADFIKSSDPELRLEKFNKKLLDSINYHKLFKVYNFIIV